MLFINKEFEEAGETYGRRARSQIDAFRQSARHPEIFKSFS